MYHFTVEGSLSLPDTYDTPEQVHEAFRAQYPDRNEYTLQEVRIPKLSDLLSPGVVISALRETSQVSLGDDSWLDFENSEQASSRHAEIESLVGATLDDWQDVRKVELPGFIVIKSTRIKVS